MSDSFNVYNSSNIHCVKSIHFLSFPGPYFPAFELNTEIYRVILRILSECDKIQIRKTQKTGTFHLVIYKDLSMARLKKNQNLNAFLLMHNYSYT